MSSGVKWKGVDKAVSKFKAGELNAHLTLKTAIQLSLNLIRNEARTILEDHYRTVPKNSWERPLTGALYKGFRTRIIESGTANVAGELYNDVQEALWLDQGTEGHEVTAINVAVMKWAIGPDEFGYSQHHWISGIEAEHFMTDAMEQCREGVIEIFRYCFKNPELAEEMAVKAAIYSGLSEDDNIEEMIMM